MGCCSGRSPSPVSRPAGVTTRRPGGPSSGAAGPDPQPPRTSVRLTYRGARPATVIGPVTGRRYRFDLAAPGVEVDPRDQRGLLATTYFAKVPLTPPTAGSPRTSSPP
jgi:hypothetical protein